MWQLTLFILIATHVWMHGAADSPQVPCFFIFGDSLEDNGNNNDLCSSAGANFHPYGIDFPRGPTGRFGNGRTPVDFLAEYLGFDHYIPPFACPGGAKILEGLNYASGGSGILNETGRHLGQRWCLARQLQHHRLAVSHMVDLMGSQESVEKHLRKCIYHVGMGNNDYINNYYVPGYSFARSYSPLEFAKMLMEEYAHHLRTLHNYGARKIALVGLGKIGCIPRAIIHSHGGKFSRCAEGMNKAAQLFNKELIWLVDQLNNDFPDAQFTYINSYGMAEGDPTSHGFRVLTSECCEVNGGGQCVVNKNPCPNRTEYLFWDSFHPTEAANKILAARTYSVFDPTDCYPFDLRHLVGKHDLEAPVGQPNASGKHDAVPTTK